jgi:23S rRNA (pseudouridine1915-N3)-methyltransferase
VKFVFYRFEPKKSKWVEAASNELVEKISHFHKVEILALPESQNNKDFFKKNVKARDFLIAFDEEGVELSSTKFSLQIEKIKNQSFQRICFVLGPAYGLHEKIMSESDLKLSLSKFTLNHQIAFVVALEQLYRSITISKNHPYHHE